MTLPRSTQVDKPSLLLINTMVLGQTYFYLAEVLHYTLLVNLTQPLLGKDMGDGWETRRNREPSHKDWVIIKLYVNNMLSDVRLTSKV